MDNETRIQNCIARITAWYPGVRRSLPWRESPTPYRVWISEIMLQQTRIEAVSRPPRPWPPWRRTGS